MSILPAQDPFAHTFDPRIAADKAAIELKPLSKHKDRRLVVDYSVLEHCSAKHM